MIPAEEAGFVSIRGHKPTQAETSRSQAGALWQTTQSLLPSVSLK